MTDAEFMTLEVGDWTRYEGEPHEGINLKTGDILPVARIDRIQKKLWHHYSFVNRELYSLPKEYAVVPGPTGENPQASIVGDILEVLT